MSVFIFLFRETSQGQSFQDFFIIFSFLNLNKYVMLYVLLCYKFSVRKGPSSGEKVSF